MYMYILICTHTPPYICEYIYNYIYTQQCDMVIVRTESIQETTNGVCRPTVFAECMATLQLLVAVRTQNKEPTKLQEYAH